MGQLLFLMSALMLLSIFCSILFFCKRFNQETNSLNKLGKFLIKLERGNVISHPAFFNFFKSFAINLSITPIIFILCLFNSDTKPTEKNTDSSRSMIANIDFSINLSGLVFSSQKSTLYPQSTQVLEILEPNSKSFINNKMFKIILKFLVQYPSQN